MLSIMPALCQMAYIYLAIRVGESLTHVNSLSPSLVTTQNLSYRMKFGPTPISLGRGQPCKLSPILGWLLCQILCFTSNSFSMQRESHQILGLTMPHFLQAWWSPWKLPLSTLVTVQYLDTVWHTVWVRET